jgi:hypothetical protein
MLLSRRFQIRGFSDRIDARDHWIDFRGGSNFKGTSSLPSLKTARPEQLLDLLLSCSREGGDTEWKV